MMANPYGWGREGCLVSPHFSKFRRRNLKIVSSSNPKTGNKICLSRTIWQLKFFNLGHICRVCKIRFVLTGSDYIDFFVKPTIFKMVTIFHFSTDSVNIKKHAKIFFFWHFGVKTESWTPPSLFDF